MSAKLPCGRPTPARVEKSRHSESARNWREHLATYLQSKDLKQSESRNRIVEILVEEPGHFSVQGLVKKIQAAYPKIGAATVYRNLPVLLDCGLIRESLTDEAGQKIYEVASSPFSQEEAHHDHIVCLDCGRIFEFHEEVIESAQEKVSRKMSFKPVEHRHVIYARCSYRTS